MTVFKLKTPISEKSVRKLKVNDIVYISGTIICARDAAHKRALEYQKEEKKLPVGLEGSVIFHCGPIATRSKNQWKIVAAGPTTSSRMNVFEDKFIKNFNVRIIIGKGGMDNKTATAMKKYGAVYGAFTGGAAVLGAKAIKKVKGIEWNDLGIPEAVWILEVENFGPLTIAIDSHGENLYEEIQKKVQKNKKMIYKKFGL
ncbi:MAG: FumA C-terminus/TtdB family hydratase beta subunit [Candidatus Bathyarchaeota archaeon]